MTTQKEIPYAPPLDGDTHFDLVNFEHKETLSESFHTTVQLTSFDDNPNFMEILDQAVTSGASEAKVQL